MAQALANLCSLAQARPLESDGCDGFMDVHSGYVYIYICICGITDIFDIYIYICMKERGTLCRPSQLSRQISAGLVDLVYWSTRHPPDGLFRVSFTPTFQSRSRSIRRCLESRDIFEDLLKIRRVDLAMPPLSLAIGQEQGRRTFGTTAGTVHVDLLVRCARAAGVGICVQFWN